jgi:RNA polymerase sigma-70 factor, ECF subfamily
MPTLQSDPPDSVLIQRLQQGDGLALTSLYSRYSGLVYTIALRILARTEDAEDLTQEIFLTFWKDQKFDASRAALSTYLSLLTRSRALNRLDQRASRQRSLDRFQQIEPAWTSATPLDHASQLEQQQHLQTALGQLSDKQRQILELSYYQGLSQSAIAEQINLPLGTVKTNARQGLLKLRQILSSALGHHAEGDRL